MIFNIQFPETNIYDGMSEEVEKGVFRRFIDFRERAAK
jgi:hypothetical protein